MSSTIVVVFLFGVFLQTLITECEGGEIYCFCSLHLLGGLSQTLYV